MVQPSRSPAPPSKRHTVDRRGPKPSRPVGRRYACAQECACMNEGVRVIGTGIYVDTYPDPERAIEEAAATLGRHLSPETRAEIVGWRAGDLVFVRLTPFVEFDDGSGPARWEGTPQG